MGALSGLRVIDFGQYIAGPMLGMMLADNGADVIRVDPPGGPMWDHPANAMLQRGKRSIALDLKSDEGRATAADLIRSADIVIENFRPGVMARLKLGADEMLAAAPGLIYCSLPGFASHDPRSAVAGWDIIVGAAAGLYNTPAQASYFLSTNAPDADEPLWSAVPSPSIVAAFSAAIAVTAAIYSRGCDGRGQKIEVPLFNAMFEMIGYDGMRLDPKPDVPDYIHPASIFLAKASDGRFFQMAMAEDWHFHRVADALFPTDWKAEGMSDPDRIRRDSDLAFELRRRLFALFATRPADEWVELLSGLHVPCSPCQSAEEWIHDPHAHASGAIVTVEDPLLGRTEQAGFPALLSRSPPRVGSPRHLTDQDRAAVIAEARNVRPPNPPAGATRPQALAGVKVVDVTEVLAGPVAGRILAEYGAEVVKINRPTGWATAHCTTNGGKRTMLLDLKRPEALEIVRPIIADADVFVQNFARGVMETLHLGEADLREINPAIVYASLSAFGYRGPLGGGRGYEPMGQALTGIVQRFGDPGRPIRTRLAICDHGTGMLGAFGVLLALIDRQRTGEGQGVQASLSQTATYHQFCFMLDFPGHERAEPGGQHIKGLHPFHRFYRSADAWFAIAVREFSDEALQEVFGAIGAGPPDLASPAQAESALAALFVTAPSATWIARLARAGIAAHVVHDFEDVMDDPWARSEGLAVERDHPGIGRVRITGPSARLSQTPAVIGAPARLPGYDTSAILAEIGMADRVDPYVREGIVAVEPVPGTFHA